MHKSFGRCTKGKRCYKTIHKYPFVKFNFVCAIKYGCELLKITPSVKI